MVTMSLGMPLEVIGHLPLLLFVNAIVLAGFFLSAMSAWSGCSLVAKSPFEDRCMSTHLRSQLCRKRQRGAGGHAKDAGSG